MVICSIVFLSIVTDFTRDIPNTWEYATSRIVDTTIGIIFAVIVNQFFFRSHDAHSKAEKSAAAEHVAEAHVEHQE